MNDLSVLLLSSVGALLVCVCLIQGRKLKQVELRNQELVFENSRLKDNIGIDMLTGLLSPNVYLEHFEAERRRLERAVTDNSKENIFVFFVDINRFKTINDSYGHQFGDHVLRMLASRLKEIARRDSDLVARRSGDEFLLLFWYKDEAAARLLIDKVHHATTFFAYTEKSVEVPITCSIGVARMVGVNGLKTLKQVLHEAERSMYQGKGEADTAVTVHAEPI